MAAHVSVRLYWHDSGWDGTICRDPAANVWCEAHDHVRENKATDEADHAGKAIDEAAIKPACEFSAQAFSRRRNVIKVWPPDWMANWGVQPVDVEADTQTSAVWPYEDMWREDGGQRDNDARREIAEAFLGEIEEGKSLAFFYVDERNPLMTDDGERSPSRVLVGVSRIKRVGDIVEWEQDRNGEVDMVWSVPFKHAFPDDGIRLPVQALHAAVDDPESRARYLVALDGGTRTDFRYGSHRVSLDRALIVVERAITALRLVQEDGVLDQSVGQELTWLNALLLELWDERGSYPGLAPVLRVLGCERPVELTRVAVDELTAAGIDPVEAIVHAFDGNVHAVLEPFEDDLEEAGTEWRYLDSDEQRLARLLCRMELDVAQVECLLSREARQRHRLPGDADAIVANPYVLVESFKPDGGSESIGFMTVDHGLLPHESMARWEDRVSKRDPRRLRALLVLALRDAAANGDTFASAGDIVEAAAQASPEDRRCDVPLDRLGHERVAGVLDEVIERFTIDGRPFLALHEVRRHELEIEEFVDALAGRAALTSDQPDWQALADELTDNGADPIALSHEQRAALARSFANPISVLAGAAGTGKSTLLAPLVAAIHRADGQVPIWILTPTGKAADRLKDLDVPARTIHSMLARAGWFDRTLGCFRLRGKEPLGVDTLIIDEASMIDVELLATLAKAVDVHRLRRLVLVGDHHQLPPIGPGRPFFDLVAAMTAADAHGGRALMADRLSDLQHNYRVDEGSTAVAFASGFAGKPVPNEPLIWSSLARGVDQGDLRVRFWDTEAELHRLMIEEIQRLAERARVESDDEIAEDKAFDATIGHHDGLDASFWQGLSPMRGYGFGTTKLNAVVQDHFHGWSKHSTRRWAPVKFGVEQITWNDKVIQTANETFNAYSRERRVKEEQAVFNGQIGRVVWTHPRPFRRGRPASETGNPKFLKVEFEGLPGWTFDFTKTGSKSVDWYLELAYAITVHKSQGSQFRHVFFVVPQAIAHVFGRELTYTGLTRAQESLTLFVERDVGALLGLRRRLAARTPRRNSRLFAAAQGVDAGYRASGLVHISTSGLHVRSKSEVVVANLLEEYAKNGRLTYEYERVLEAPGSNGQDLRLPDFTVSAGGRTFYWEHCGMVDDPTYLATWEQVRLPWYKRHGFSGQLIVTTDGHGGTIDSGKIRSTIETTILR